MTHTYFLESLKWTAKGVYFDEKENSFPLTGQVEIIRSPSQWTLTGYMEVAFPTAARFTNSYSISPTESAATLDWESFNPALGTLKGTFELIGDSIISYYQSPDGVYSGTETLVQKDAGSYYNVGVSFCRGKKMSSWTAQLTAE